MGSSSQCAYLLPLSGAVSSLRVFSSEILLEQHVFGLDGEPRSRATKRIFLVEGASIRLGKSRAETAPAALMSLEE